MASARRHAQNILAAIALIPLPQTLGAKRFPSDASNAVRRGLNGAGA